MRHEAVAVTTRKAELMHPTVLTGVPDGSRSRALFHYSDNIVSNKKGQIQVIKVIESMEKKPGTVANACDPSTWETEADRQSGFVSGVGVHTWNSSPKGAPVNTP